jgi:hypothetical protein
VPETFSYTGANVATEVKAQFGDTGNVQITDADVLRWINNGQRQIARDNPFNEQVFTTNLLADQSVYDLNALMASARVHSYSAIVVAGKKLQVLPWQEYMDKVAEQETGSREPIIASEYGGKLTLWPTPAESVVQGLVIYYVAWPADLTAIGQTLTIPDRFYNALLAFVHSRAQQLDENYEAAGALMEEHSQAVGAELQRDKMDPVDYYPAITYDPRY